jgi:hypothetical protein
MSHPGIPHRNAESSQDSGRGHQGQVSAESIRASQGKLPKIQFPSFNGKDPQLWKSHCDSYFEMYTMEYILWVKVASMHLEGTTVRRF